MRGLYAILDLTTLEANKVDPLAFASEVLSVRPCALQLRAKDHPARQTLGLLRALVPLCRGARVPLVCNDRADLAILAGCDMVHLGQEDAPVELVRRLSPGLGIGVSTHDLDQLGRALDTKPRYVAFGPVFPTTTKQNPSPVVGLGRLREASAMARARGIPLVAIGGISLDNAADVGQIADAAALISGLMVERRFVRANAMSFHAALGGREALMAAAPA
jgi:thiamine-phosphate pyrophosphorylase